MTRFPVFVLVVLLLSKALCSQAHAAMPDTLEEARQQFDGADAELNRVYLRCYRDLAERPAAQAALQDAQRLWVKCRDQTAEAAAGTAPIHRLDDTYRFHAETVLTQSRIKELKELFVSGD